MSYEEIVSDANNLYKAYLVSVKSGPWKESTQKFMLDFLRNIFSIQEDLMNRTLQNGTTHEFNLSERGKIRAITAYTIRDRIIRHCIMDEILIPKIRSHIIYDNCSSLKDRGLALQQKRFEIMLHRYYSIYGNDGYILFGDFSKFYENIIHDIAKEDLLKLVDHDEFMAWLLDVIFDGFKVDVSYMSDEEYEHCLYDNIFNRLEYRKSISRELLIGEKFMHKSINIGDQLSQGVGIYYPNPIDMYIKTVCSEKFYGRYADDFFLMSPSKEHLLQRLSEINEIAISRGIHLNMKKTHISKISGRYTFLQIRYSLYSNGRICKRINPKRVRKMETKIKKLSIKVSSGEVPYENVENMFRGWMGNYYKIIPKDRRKQMIQLYEDSFNKAITIENRKMLIKEKEVA